MKIFDKKQGLDIIKLQNLQFGEPQMTERGPGQCPTFDGDGQVIF